MYALLLLFVMPTSGSVNRLLQVTIVPYVESGNNLDFYPPTHMYIYIHANA